MQPANPYFGEMVIVTKSHAARDRLKAQFEACFEKGLPGTDILVQPLNLGPPVGRPIQYRVSGRTRQGQGARA